MNEPDAVEELKRAMDVQEEAAEALRAELSRRTQGIDLRRRRVRTWDETKREILGRLA